MAKVAKFKVTAPWLKKAGAAHKRALSAWYRLPPEFACRAPYTMKEKAGEALYLYAAALGMKRGLLPVSLGGWSAYTAGPTEEGTAEVRFCEPGKPPVLVELKHLHAWPAPAIEETVETEMREAA